MNEDAEVVIQQDEPALQSMFSDIYPYLFEWLIILFFVGVHQTVTYALDVPGCGNATPCSVLSLVLSCH